MGINLLLRKEGLETLTNELTIEYNTTLRVNYQDGEDMDRYLTDLVGEIQGMYENITDNVNGFIRNNADVDQSQWVPTISSTGVKGTIIYTRQVGWSVRQGIFTELWFDIEWTASGGSTGKMYIDLPYKVTVSDGMPFIGTVQLGSISINPYTSSYVNAISNTYQASVWLSGHALPPFEANMQPSGRLIGHIRYIGLEDE